MTTKILLVEDDYEQAMLFAQVLKIAGYAVEIVASAEEAQTQLHAETFSLLLADWDLAGGMNGDALIVWSKAQYPAMKTILSSNHPQVVEIAAACGTDAMFRKIDVITKLRQLAMQLAPVAG